MPPRLACRRAWSKCRRARRCFIAPIWENNLHVCPEMQFPYAAVSAQTAGCLLDPDARFEIGTEVKPVDPPEIQDSKKYPDRLHAANEDTGEDDALVVMEGSVHNIPLVAAAFEFRFIGGSMGRWLASVLSAPSYTCLDQNLPFVCVTASGGARMQGRGCSR